MPVYIVQAGPASAPVKIGYSMHDYGVRGRMVTIQSMHYLPLNLLRIVPTGCYVVEDWFHHRFAAERIRGEWFRFVPEMLTVEPPPRERAVASLHGLVKGVGAYQIGVAIGRPWTVVQKWSRAGGAPREWAERIARSATAHGFQVDPAAITAPPDEIIQAAQAA